MSLNIDWQEVIGLGALTVAMALMSIGISGYISWELQRLFKEYFKD